MIRIYCYYFNSPLADEQWQMLCKLLPDATLKKVLKFRRWQDRNAALFGRLLLKMALSEAGYPPTCLESLQYDCYNRPSIDSNIDFNISHSKEYVLCAITKSGRIGIDIEHIRELEIGDFKNFMSNDEWHAIYHADNPIRRFYHYWTIKESVMKADGRGLNIPPKDIISYPDYAFIGNKKWGLKEISIADQYCCHLAFEQFCSSSITHQLVSYNFGNNTLYPISVFEILH